MLLQLTGEQMYAVPFSLGNGAPTPLSLSSTILMVAVLGLPSVAFVGLDKKKRV